MCHILWHYTVRRHVYTWETPNKRKERCNLRSPYDLMKFYTSMNFVTTDATVRWDAMHIGQVASEHIRNYYCAHVSQKGRQIQGLGEKRERERRGRARRHAEKSRNIGSRVSLWRAKTHTRTHTEDIKPYYYRYYSIARSLKCSSNDVPCCWRRRRYNVRSEYWTQM